MSDTLKFESVLVSEYEHIRKLHQIVIDSVNEEKLLSEKLFEFEEKQLSASQKLADKVASFGGSWGFIITLFSVMLIWILLNASFLRSGAIDPYPFILLNLILSCIAAAQAPIIMMSQNRKESKDRMRAQNDYLVNLKAEIEIRNLHQKIDLLIAEQMKSLFELQKAQLEMMEEIKQQIDMKVKF